MKFKIGREVRVINHRWKGSPNIPIGTVGLVDSIRVSKDAILPIGVWFDLGTGEYPDEYIAWFEPEDLEVLPDSSHTIKIKGR